MANGEMTKMGVLAYLDSQDIKYTDVSTSEFQCIKLGWATDSMTDIIINVFFDESGESVHLSTMLPLRVSDDKLAPTLVEVNRCNKEYRWIDFYLDDDSTVMGEMDAVVDPSSAGKEVHALLSKMVRICDEVYPSFMKLIWS